MGAGAVIGLDIGNTTIKVVEVRSGKGGPYVAALGIAPTPLDSITQNMVIDAQALGAAIKELLQSCGAKARQVVSSVAGQQSLVVRIIEVPRMTPKELAATMKWEVERHVPFASSDLQMDYKVIERPDTPPEASTMEVLLVVAQQEMVNAHIEVLEGAGLDPLAIDVEPLAAARSLVDVRGAEEAGRTIALVNIGAQLTDISIVRDGNMLFQRTIATAGDSLTQAIAASLNISNEEADHLKKMRAAVDMDAFAAPADDAAVFGGGDDAPFGFGVPGFEPFAASAPEGSAAPAAAEETTLFNPFAEAPAAAPAAQPEAPFNPFGAAPVEAPPAQPEAPFNPFAAPPAEPAPAAQPDAEAAPQWSPFGAAGQEEPAGLAVPAPDPAPAAAPDFAPFGDGASDGDGFDLSAFSADDAGGVPAAGVGADEITTAQIFALIRDPLGDLVTEIKRSVDYYRGRAGDANIDAVYVSGGTARLPNLDQLLNAEIGVPVVVANPFQSVPVQSKQYPEEYLQQIAPMFAVSVGLGLREMVS